MTKEEFIRKWLGNPDKPYTEENRNAMRDELYALCGEEINPNREKLVKLECVLKESCRDLERGGYYMHFKKIDEDGKLTGVIIRKHCVMPHILHFAKDMVELALTVNFDEFESFTITYPHD